MITTLNWTAIIVAAISLVGSIITAYFLYKAKLVGKNNKPKNNPGNPSSGSFLCYAHGERLLKIEMRQENIKGQLMNLQDEMKEIKRSLSV